MGSKAAQDHLSKSLFPVVIGSNDIIGYFNEGSDVQKKYTPQQYVTLMVSNLKQMLKVPNTPHKLSRLKHYYIICTFHHSNWQSVLQIQGIYGLGARRFLLVGLSPIGCAPKQRYPSATNECNEQVNSWSNKYNEELKQMLAELQSELKDFRYSYFDTYRIFVDFVQNPAVYGTT